jgi:hypothetical protein
MNTHENNESSASCATEHLASEFPTMQGETSASAEFIERIGTIDLN